MKSTEEHFDDYLDTYNELKLKNELWRLSTTPDQFLTELEKIRVYGIEARKRNYFNEYHIQKNQDSMISIMLMNKLTLDEFKEQSKRLKEKTNLPSAEEVLAIQKRLTEIQVPLNQKNIRDIYNWLFYKQITLEMLPQEVFEEFSQTRQYELILNRNAGDK